MVKTSNKILPYSVQVDEGWRFLGTEVKMKNRGFEIVTKYLDKHINLPRRQTPLSAGYDFEAAEDAVLMPYGVAIVPTGVKAYMRDFEVLEIYIRSGIAVKQGIVLANQVGIIDADYYDNAENEGHIMIALRNMTDKEIKITKGERIAQGIFKSYLIADVDETVRNGRLGGFGSTGR